MEITTVYFILGFCVVFVFATNYFNQPGYNFVDPEQADNSKLHDELLEPALPRYLTERFEFNFFRAAFVLITECVYVSLVLFLPEFILSTAVVNNAVGGATAGASDTIATNSGNILERIILATLIITGLVPNIPWIKDLLEKSKFYLHKKAQIPYKGRAIYHRIKHNRPIYEKERIGEILSDSRFQHNGVDHDGRRDDLEAEYFEQSSWELEARWAKLCYLLYFINRWSLKLPFKSYIQNTELHYASIESHYQDLVNLMRAHKAGEISGANHLRLETILDTTLNRSYRLISCLLYLAAKSDSDVDGYLDELGYESSVHNEFPIPWNTLIWIIFAVIGSVVAGSVVSLLIIYYNDPISLPHDFTPGEVMSWIGYGTPFILLPVLLVLLIKRYLSIYSDSWPTVTEQGVYSSINARPWFIYFISALSSYLLGALVLTTMVVSIKYLHEEDYKLLELVHTLLAWSSVVFLTAVFAAYRLDSGAVPEKQSLRYYLSRCAGIVSQGMLTAGLIYLVTLYNDDKPLHIIFNEDYALDPKVYILCVIGFFLGVSINIAIGIGRLRQRRKHGRYIASRKLSLQLADQQSSEADTMNISNEGALVSVKDILMVRGKQAAKDSSVYLSRGEGAQVEAKIIKKRGNRLHLWFKIDDENINNWKLLRQELNLPGSAG
jgi:hypothetical protein